MTRTAARAEWDAHHCANELDPPWSLSSGWERLEQVLWTAFGTVLGLGLLFGFVWAVTE